MKAHVYELKCLTNMHAGSGDGNYDIVDARVEKDPVTEMPTIYSSGVKGAIREHLEQLAKKEPDKELEALIIKCLGNAEEIVENNGKKKRKTNPGSYRFLSGQMIARPLRISAGKGAYVLAAARECLEDYRKLLAALNADICNSEALPEVQDKNCIVTAQDGIEVEGYKTTKVAQNGWMKKLIGDNWALTDCETLKEFSLPVQARNVLDENGISENLWYEEVVPHESVFHMILITPDETNELDKYLNGQIIQFGADASIGYGLCKVTKLSK